MRGSGLQSLAILHHGLDSQRVERTGEPLVRTLVSHHDRHSHIVTGKIRIYVDHPGRLCDSLLACCVSRMPLLPQEFGGPQEKAGPHLPSHYIGPLVAQDWQIPP